MADVFLGRWKQVSLEGAEEVIKSIGLSNTDLASSEKEYILEISKAGDKYKEEALVAKVSIFCIEYELGKEFELTQSLLKTKASSIANMEGSKLVFKVTKGVETTTTRELKGNEMFEKTTTPAGSMS